MSKSIRDRRPVSIAAHAAERLQSNIGPIEYRAIAGLRDHCGNPRKHSDKQIVKLMASIRRFGVALPVLIDEAGTIVAGEAVTEAARRLGLADLPVIVASAWNDAQVKAFRLASNRLAELATWDEDLLAIEIASIIELGDRRDLRASVRATQQRR